jgi:tetratricopeptide (TPR) repeat protein
MNKKKQFLIITFCILTSSLLAQDLLNQLGKAFQKEVGKKGSELKESLDSIDYQFAISVNENAGFFDMNQKGESDSKFLYAFKDQADKTPVEIARDTLEIGIGYYELRWFNLAEQSFRSAEKYIETNTLTENLVYLRTISNIGLLCLTQGKNADAETYLTKALAFSEEKLGKQSPAYIANLNNMGKLHQALGKYNEAEKEFQEAMTLGETYFGEGMQRAILLNNKAMLLQSVGRYDEAKDLMQKAVKASLGTSKKKTKTKRKSFDNRRFSINLAFIYQLSGDYAKAEATFLETRKIFENRSQTMAPEYAGLLNQLGILYIQMSKQDKVEALLKKSKDIYKTRFTDQNTFYAKVTDDLGNFYRLSGRYEEAEKQLNKALEIRETLLGTSHPDYVKTQENLAILYWKTNRYDQAYIMYREVMDKTIDFINRYFPPMSEAEKTNFWDVTAPRFQRFFNFALEAGTQLKYVTQDFFDYQMATKALLLNSTNKVKEAILKSKDKKLISDYLLWLDQKEQLARLYNYSKEQLKEQKIDLA